MHSALKDAALEENTVSTFEALNPDVSAESGYLPLIVAAGVLLLEANYIAQLYLHDHSFSLKAGI